MRHSVAIPVILAILLSLSLVSPEVQGAAQVGPAPTIQVIVTDQAGLSVNGATVEVIAASNLTLVSAGRTVNGSFTTQTLLIDSNYTVIVSTPAQTESQTVALGSTNIVVQFTIMRALPVEALLVTRVTQTLNRTGAGWDAVADISVNNTGATPITFSSLALTSTGPLTVLGAGSDFSLGPVPPGGGTVVRVVFGVQDNTAADIYPVGYVLTFTDVYSRTASSAGSFGLDLNGIATGPDVVISSLTVSSDNLAPGENVVLTVGLLNSGDQPAAGVSVSVQSPDVTFSSNQTSAGVLAPSGTASRDFGASIPKALPSGVYTVTVSVTYANGEGKQFTSIQPYTVRIYPRGEPDVLVQSILTDPTKLTDGTTGVMTIFLANVGTDQARDIIVKMSGATGLLANGDFTVGKIDPGATETVLLTINVGSNVPTGTYLVSVQLGYSDPVGTSFNSSSFEELSVFTLPTIFTPVNIGLMAGAAVIILAALIVARRLGVRI